MTLLSPPPLERFSAEKFRRWLADNVSQDAPPTDSDRDAMKAALVEFLSVCPRVFGLKDRKTMWEKIGNAAMAALETCNADLMVWVNEVFASIQAESGRVATCKELGPALDKLESTTDAWKAGCLRTMRDLRFTIPKLARVRWNAVVKGAEDGDE